MPDSRPGESSTSDIPAATLGSTPHRRSVHATIGLPGAGKTTAALRWVADDPDHRVRVGFDEIATMLHRHAIADPAAYRPRHALLEQLTTHAIVQLLLACGLDVVCDAPFLVPGALDALHQLATRCGADLIVWDMTNVSVDECIRRDAHRGRDGGPSIGADEIRRQAKLYLGHHGTGIGPS